MTKQNGVDVWPNAAIWMWDELRFKVKRQHTAVHVWDRMARVGQNWLLLFSSFYCGSHVLS